MNRVLWLGLGALWLAGCQTARPLYYRGHYEGKGYLNYYKPGKVSVDQQILDLEEDIQKAAAANLPVHPGLHAHLWYLYAQRGKQELAHREFEAEKNLFSESTAFIDRMLKSSKPQ